ncbi:hypothetical protein, partial [Parabacteroides sp. AF17-28]|uniref:hypothetical protein n=1 Tax=Parabacteroides sp. AF17-28 TaxID=2292241 RepID=UPI001F3974F0
DRPNLCEVPSTLHISTVMVAIRTVVIGENAQKRGKSPFLTVKKRINICSLLEAERKAKRSFLQ